MELLRRPWGRRVLWGLVMACGAVQLASLFLPWVEIMGGGTGAARGAMGVMLSGTVLVMGPLVEMVTWRQGTPLPAIALILPWILVLAGLVGIWPGLMTLSSSQPPMAPAMGAYVSLTAAGLGLLLSLALGLAGLAK